MAFLAETKLDELVTRQLLKNASYHYNIINTKLVKSIQVNDQLVAVLLVTASNSQYQLSTVLYKQAGGRLYDESPYQSQLSKTQVASVEQATRYIEPFEKEVRSLSPILYA